ncbi:hypothetical protein VTN96DRAFT_796 [Rasamsonia emersonii]|uniref:Short-chain dehydrogenase n=1 Tax=Rasamsonia emersonii (strain ATCC 16479 / CBS 393.64 / IMI 116815) TaxID=1408163 RepID=A0A0F4Z1U5_RASE3|nr:short-chain dehydrogenase [Rasamsonia emersonii CBS 393.64]KKA24479.1 short-chain dehydrogenase [Rasamsonia emersonii CBS 393.64]
MASYLITGASCGLGLALVKVLLDESPEKIFQVIATCREESPDLRKLKQDNKDRLFVVGMNIMEEDSIRQAVAQVEEITGKGLDILINNAGIMNETLGGITEMNDLVPTFCANVNSVHLVTRAFLPLLRNGKERKVLNISSSMGSIALASQYTNQAAPAYKISKTALNMLTVQYALEFGKEGLIFILANPGWLQTDLCSTAADLPAGTGAKAVLEILHNASANDNGRFFNINVPTWTPQPGQNEYRGGIIPW